MSLESLVAQLEAGEAVDDDVLRATAIGPFALEGTLGAGGMGVVFSARDQRLGRAVALKAMRSKRAADATARERFLREARACAALSHPNVATIYDVGEDEGVLFMAMERVDGKSLRALLPPEGVPAREALRVAVQMCEGLAAAHRQGIVHRDLKPENVMMTPEGRVVILDFGLARLDPSAPAGEQTGDLSLTEEGQILGTPAYMSPEQATGKPADARSDVYAVGLMLYELLSGQRPFADRTHVVELIMAIVQEAPLPLEVLKPELPRPLCDLVRRCLAKAPGQRPADAGELLAELAAIDLPSPPAATPLATFDAGGPPRVALVAADSAEHVTPVTAPDAAPLATHQSKSDAPTPMSGSRRWRVVAVSATAVAMAITALSFGWWRPSAGPPPAQAGIPVVDDDPAVQRRFVGAVEAFYRADFAQMRRELEALIPSIDRPLIPLGLMGQWTPEQKKELNRLLLAERDHRPRERELAQLMRSTLSHPPFSNSGDEARAAFKAYADEHPDDLFALMLAWRNTWMLMRETEVLEKLNAAEPTLPLLWWVRSVLPAWRAEWDTVEEIAGAALAHDPLNGALLSSFGWAKLGRQDFKGAQQQFEKVLALDADDIEALNGLAFALAMQDDDPDAQERYLDVVLSDGTEPAARGLATAFVARQLYAGQIKRGLANLERVTQRLQGWKKLRGQTWTSHLSMAVAVARTLELWSVFDRYLALLEQAPTDPRVDPAERDNLLLKVHVERANVALYRGSADEIATSRQAVEAMLERAPPSSKLHERTRKRLEALDRVAEAVSGDVTGVEAAIAEEPPEEDRIVPSDRRYHRAWVRAQAAVASGAPDADARLDAVHALDDSCMRTVGGALAPSCTVFMVRARGLSATRALKRGDREAAARHLDALPAAWRRNAALLSWIPEGI